MKKNKKTLCFSCTVIYLTTYGKVDKKLTCNCVEEYNEYLKSLESN